MKRLTTEKTEKQPLEPINIQKKASLSAIVQADWWVGGGIGAALLAM